MPCLPATMAPRDAVPATRMDPPPSPLHGLVAELAESERFRAFVDDFPASHACPSPRSRSCSPRCTRRSDSRSSACSPRTSRRGTRPRPSPGTPTRRRSRSCRAAASVSTPGSSRRRTSSASGRGRSPCSPRRARVRIGAGARGGPAARGRQARLARIRSATSSASTASWRRSRSPGTSAPSGSTSAGRSRFAAASSTSSRARAASRFASSSSATRSSRSARSRRSRSARCTPSSTRSSIRRRSAAGRPRADARRGRGSNPGRPRSSARSRTRPRLAAGRRAASVGGGGRRAPALENAAELDPFPHAQPHSFEAQRPAIAARGLAEAETELAGMLRQGRRVLVAFPHRGEALRTQRLLRKVDAEVVEEVPALAEDPSLRFVVSPARRGFVWRDLGLALLPDAQVFRKRPPRADARLGRALQSFADLRTGDYVVHEDHGVGRLLGFETKEVAGVTRDYLYLAFRGEDRLYVPHEQLPKVSRYIGADARLARAVEARRQGLAEPQEPRAGVGARARRRAPRALRPAPAGARARVRPEPGLARAARGVLPVPGDRRPAAGDRGRQGGSRGADGRWTGSSAATSASARRRSRCGRRSRPR